MHVAIVSPYSMARPGGVQEHVRGLAKQLCKIGHQVTLFGPELRGEQADLNGVATISLGSAIAIPANGSVAPLGVDPRMIVRYDLGLDPADVIHLHEPFLPAGLFALLRRPDHTAIVGTFHAAADGFWPYAIAAPVLRRASRRLDVTTAVSPAARRLVRRYVAVDPEIVPNGVDVDKIQAAQPDPWARSLSDDVVVFIGRAEPRKDFGTVARAFADVAATHTNAHLVATVDALPDGVVCERIHCIGRVDSERRDALLRAADICVVPSLGGESFGVVVAEGLAAGTAVISSDIPGYRFAGGDAALYVKPGDVPAWRGAMARLLDDRNERARLAAAGPGRARGFDWSRVAEATVAVYERAIA